MVRVRTSRGMKVVRCRAPTPYSWAYMFWKCNSKVPMSVTHKPELILNCLGINHIRTKTTKGHCYHFTLTLRREISVLSFLNLFLGI